MRLDIFAHVRQMVLFTIGLSIQSTKSCCAEIILPQAIYLSQAGQHMSLTMLLAGHSARLVFEHIDVIPVDMWIFLASIWQLLFCLDAAILCPLQ